jgi:hypothetical protein
MPFIAALEDREHVPDGVGVHVASHVLADADPALPVFPT